MRVISWNMGLADRSRRFLKTHDEAWRFLLDLRPDLAFTQESLPPDWAENEGRIVRDPFKKWGSAVFSPRLAIEPLTLPGGNPLRALPNYLAFGDIQLDDAEHTLVASIHAPPRSADGDILGEHDPDTLRRSVEGPKYNDAIFAGLVPLVERRSFIFASDWNTSRRQATDRDSRAGNEFFTRVGEARWHDCTWSKLEEEIQTWFGAGKVKQDDYVFCDLELGERVSNVAVAEDAATKLNLSDHAPLIVDFDQV